jgi:VCBS repeat-containing protein
MKPKALLMAILGGLLLWTVSATTALGQKEKETVLKTGKEGEITLTQPTKVGDVTLQPDTYVVQHRVSGNQHYVRFMQVKKLHDLHLTPETMGWYTYTAKDNAGEIRCRVEAVGKPFQETMVDVATLDGAPHITRVAIKGEDDWHIFQ